MLANDYLFTYPTDAEQHRVPVHLMNTSTIFSGVVDEVGVLLGRWVGYREGSGIFTLLLPLFS